MNIAVYCPAHAPFSVKAYVNNILRCLENHSVRFYRLETLDAIPSSSDLLWDPTSTGAAIPPAGFRQSRLPKLVTVHGAGWAALPWKELYRSPWHAMYSEIRNVAKRYYWRRQIELPILTVSRYAKEEIVDSLAMPEDNIHVVYHGVDHETFFPGNEQRAYFLHVSQCQPKKNIPRLLEAYCGIVNDAKPPLVVIAPGYRGGQQYRSVRFITDNLSHKQLADFYRRAISFLFPSLHETFGLPILEAMACGAPVITSSTTACHETAADGALLVDPYSIKELRQAMIRLMDDSSLCHELSRRGIQRAAEFSWETSANEHMTVFRKIAERRQGKK